MTERSGELRFSTAEPDNDESVLQILNAVAKNLHDRGIQQWREGWDRQEIQQALKKGYVTFCHIQEQLIGLFFLQPEDKNRPLNTKKENCLYLCHLALMPEFQHQGWGLRIIGAIQDQAAALGQRIYLDCWEGNNRLKQFYSQAGFVSQGVMDEKDYQIHVFCYEPSGLRSKGETVLA